MNRTGRGGAGNYKSAQQAAVEQQEAIHEQDLELGRTQTNASTQSDQSNKLERVTSREESVVKTGRGGAGNYSTPEDLGKTEFENTIKTKPKVPKTETAPNFRGRGGAGNHQTDSAEQAASEKLRAEQFARQARLDEAKVIRDVEAALPMPPQAHVHYNKHELSR